MLENQHPVAYHLIVCDVSLVYTVMLMNRQHKIAAIWTYFTFYDGNQSKVDSNKYSAKISRRVTRAFSYNTCNLLQVDKTFYGI